MTPVLEVTGVLRPPGSSIPLSFKPLVLMTVDGVLGETIDLTDPKVHSALRTSLQELTGDWIVQQDEYLAGKAAMPPTQVLGQAAFDAGGVVGLEYVSSKSPKSSKGLVVFADRLVPGGLSYLEVFNTRTGALRQRLP
jgi:hypothetical protein